LAFIGNAEPAGFGAYEKCLYMFDGNEESQLLTARNRWKKYKESGFEMTYWQQSAKGNWEEGK
jgi:DNA polymerase-3 subunit chi